MDVINNQYDMAAFLTRYTRFEPAAIYRHLTMLHAPIHIMIDDHGAVTMQGADGKRVWLSINKNMD